MIDIRSAARNVSAIAEREFKAYFTSPIAYVVIGLFLAISSFFFYLLLGFAQQTPRYGNPIGIYSVFEGLFSNMVVTLFFFCPLISMRLIAEEKRGRTLELLMTAPVSEFQVITGKFAAAMSLYLIMLATTVPYAIVGYLYSEPDTSRLASGYLGVVLVGATFVALGLLSSTITANQIVAAVSAFTFILIAWFVDVAGEFIGGTGKTVLEYVAIRQHYMDFSKGIIDSKHLIYCLSAIVVSLFLSIRILETRKWR
ncbi:MAG: ABC transporter permease subunit [Candidatus Schekmanbacteria bacterium]|nr:ABC transporter permease subunit [Candidatus Schekmanbacteria bacterium]